MKIVDDLLNVIGESGAHPEVAGSQLGIPGENFAEWLGTGKRDREAGIRSDCAFLIVALQAAASGVECRVLRKIIRNPDWSAGAWFLWHRHPQRWDLKTVQIEIDATPPQG